MKFNFTESDKPQVGIGWFDDNLTRIIDHYEIDFENSKIKYPDGIEYLDNCIYNGHKSCMYHDDYLSIFKKNYNKFQYYRYRVTINKNLFTIFLPDKIKSNKNLEFIVEKIIKLNNLNYVNFELKFITHYDFKR